MVEFLKCGAECSDKVFRYALKGGLASFVLIFALALNWSINKTMNRKEVYKLFAKKNKKE